MTDWFELVDRECSDIKEYLAQHADFDIDTDLDTDTDSILLLALQVSYLLLPELGLRQ